MLINFLCSIKKHGGYKQMKPLKLTNGKWTYVIESKNLLFNRINSYYDRCRGGYI